MSFEKKETKKVYTELIKPKKKSKQLRLIVKNGISYDVSISTDKKPKFKKIKPFKQNKKWIIRDVLLHYFKVVSPIIVKQMTADNPQEKESYGKALEMDRERLYTLLLSNKQYEALTKFVRDSELEFNKVFSLRRIGTGFKTRINFSLNLTEDIPEPQENLKKSK